MLGMVQYDIFPKAIVYMNVKLDEMEDDVEDYNKSVDIEVDVKLIVVEVDVYE